MNRFLIFVLRPSVLVIPTLKEPIQNRIPLPIFIIAYYDTVCCSDVFERFLFSIFTIYWQITLDTRDIQTKNKGKRIFRDRSRTIITDRFNLPLAVALHSRGL